MSYSSSSISRIALPTHSHKAHSPDGEAEGKLGGRDDDDGQEEGKGDDEEKGARGQKGEEPHELLRAGQLHPAPAWK